MFAFCFFLSVFCPNFSNAKLQRDGKPKKVKEVDHIQHIPFKLREIMKAKDRMKTGSLKVKKPKKGIKKMFLNIHFSVMTV